MRIENLLIGFTLCCRAAAFIPQPITSGFSVDTVSVFEADKDLDLIWSDPSIESRQLAPTKSQLSTRVQNQISARQVTRSRLVRRQKQVKRRKRAQSPAGKALNPRASSSLVQRCSSSFYNLDIGGLAFHHGQAWYAPRIDWVKSMKTVGECYDYCLSMESCRAFTWYPRGSSSNGNCYRLEGDDKSTGKGWVKMGSDLPAQAGTYFLEGQCACKYSTFYRSTDRSLIIPLAGQSCCSTSAWQNFPTCPTPKPSNSTGQIAHFQNWHSFNNQVFSKRTTNRPDCETYCRQTSQCFGFVWSPALNTCWLKTGDRSKYTSSGWAYNDDYAKGDGGGFYMLDASCGEITADGKSVRVEERGRADE